MINIYLYIYSIKLMYIYTERTVLLKDLILLNYQNNYVVQTSC